MEFDWDEGKRKRNIDKHQVDFLDAALIFEGAVVVEEDARLAYGEARYRAIGLVDGEFMVVTYTLRGSVCRLISARKGGRRDRRRYQESIVGGDPRDERSG